MSEAPNPYKITLRDLRERCPLLESIYVEDGLVGKKGGEVVVRAKGKVTPRLVEQFRNAYQTAVAAGIIKRFIPIEQELRFQVKSAHIKATRIVDDYFRTLGKKKGQLRISYVEGDGQTKLGLVDKQDDKQEPLPLKGEAAAEHEELQKGRKAKAKVN